MILIEKIFRRAVLAGSAVLVPRGTPAVRLHGCRDFDLLVRTNEDMGRQLTFLGSYEKAESAYFRRHVSPTDICVDIGANVGYFSLLMARRAHGGEVHAFEPIPANAALIRASLALNGITRVSVNESAVGADSGPVSFSVSRDTAYSSMRATGRVPEVMTLQVPMLTLDSYLRERNVPRVDVLKIDVEGAEGLVLDGARDLLGNPAIGPRLVLMELYDPNLAPFGTNSAQLIQRMRSAGYRPWVITDMRGSVEVYDNRRHARYYNVLFTR